MSQDFYLGFGYAIAVLLGVIIDEVIRYKIKKEGERKEFHEMWKEERRRSGGNYHHNNKNNKN